jgi:hypothetical protein
MVVFSIEQLRFAFWTRAKDPQPASSWDQRPRFGGRTSDLGFGAGVFKSLLIGGQFEARKVQSFQ